MVCKGKKSFTEKKERERERWVVQLEIVEVNKSRMFENAGGLCISIFTNVYVYIFWEIEFHLDTGVNDETRIQQPPSIISIEKKKKKERC